MASKVAGVSLLSATTKAPAHPGHVKLYKEMARSERSEQANTLSQGSVPDLPSHLLRWVTSFLQHKKQADSSPMNSMKKI